MLCDLRSAEDFAVCIAPLRREHMMWNDDVTLLIVRPSGHDAPPCEQHGEAEERVV